MALIEKGNSLVTQLIQGGWTVANDGFGLLTSTTTYKCDHTTDIPAFAARGTAHPDLTYANLKAHKYNISWDTLGIATVKVDYVGISLTVNGGEFTDPQMSGANGLTSQNITSHPNFFTFAGSPYLGAIAGPSPYTQDTPDNIAPTVANSSGKGVSGYLGLNGSCFDKPTGGKFVGFVNPTFPQYYGKTQYLATTTTYSGIIYVKTEAYVINILSYLNTATATKAWGSWDLLPDWATVGTAGSIGQKNLLSQVNVESFGTIFKVSYEVRFADAGWDYDTYKNI